MLLAVLGFVMLGKVNVDWPGGMVSAEKKRDEEMACSLLAL